MDGSEYQKAHFGRVEGRVPDVDLEAERRLQAALRAAIGRRLVKSAHDCSEGGLAVCLAECAIGSGVNGGARFDDPEAGAAADGAGRWRGADVELPAALLAAPGQPQGAAGRPDLALFGEAPTRVVVTCAPGDAEAVEALLDGVPHRRIGVVTGDHLRCTMQGSELFSAPVSALCAAYESLPDRLA
jgi:phosphoribosylformylglycinamidine synthase